MSSFALIIFVRFVFFVVEKLIPSPRPRIKRVAHGVGEQVGG